MGTTGVSEMEVFGDELGANIEVLAEAGGEGSSVKAVEGFGGVAAGGDCVGESFFEMLAACLGLGSDSVVESWFWHQLGY